MQSLLKDTDICVDCSSKYSWSVRRIWIRIWNWTETLLISAHVLRPRLFLANREEKPGRKEPTSPSGQNASHRNWKVPQLLRTINSTCSSSFSARLRGSPATFVCHSKLTDKWISRSLWHSTQCHWRHILVMTKYIRGACDRKELCHTKLSIFYCFSTGTNSRFPVKKRLYKLAKRIHSESLNNYAFFRGMERPAVVWISLPLFLFVKAKLFNTPGTLTIQI
jgi:hypothetical protein